MAAFDKEADGLYPELATSEFVSKNIPRLSIDDFEFVEHAGDGGWGSVFKYRRKTNGKLVALKFFGMNGTAKPIGKEIENEILKDYDLSHLNCCCSKDETKPVHAHP